MVGPEQIETARLLLRKPTLSDAHTIFSRYSNDPEVTKFLSWPTHRLIEETCAFLSFSDAEWRRWPAGPYLIESKHKQLLGSTGLSFETEERAATGYVLAQDAWGRGYATEALGAMVEVARDMGVLHLFALCHPDHPASAHVLQKCGFIRNPQAERPMLFPNLATGAAEACHYYVRALK